MHKVLQATKKAFSNTLRLFEHSQSLGKFSEIFSGLFEIFFCIYIFNIFIPTFLGGLCRTIGFHGNSGWETMLQAKDGRVPLVNQDAFLQTFTAV